MAEFSEEKAYIVNGYQFESKEKYEQALSEKKGISYLNAQINLNDISKIKGLYEELIEKKLFITPVGIDYLRQLREILIKNGVSAGSLPGIYVPEDNKEQNEKTEKNLTRKYKNKINNLEKELSVKNKRLRTSVILNIALVLVIVAIFIITLTSSNANILNYERVLQDKYSSWAEDLSDKEKELRSWERELEQKENDLKE